jgi:opacity protein-like surface antigen
MTAASGPAQAQDFDRSGVYFGGSWFRVGEQFGAELDSEIENALDLTNADLSVSDSSGVAAVLGVRAGSRFALELVGERYNDLDVDLSAAGVTSAGDIEIRTGLLMGKLYLFTGPIQPYLMAGAGYLQGRVNLVGQDAVGHTVLGRGGAGIDLYLSRNWVFSVQAAYSRGFAADLDDLAFFTVGGSVLFRF